MSLPQRPPDIGEATWNAWTAVFNALPANRRTADIPTTNEEALRSINLMVTSAAAAAANPAPPIPPPLPPQTDSYRLPFTVKDVPAYTGDYMDYRRKLRDFVHIYQGMPINQVPSAMFAIKTGLVEKRMSDLGSSKDAADFSTGNRTLLEAWGAWQTWMDGLLISRTQFSAENASWETMKNKARRAQSSQEFYILFEACLFRFKEACTRRRVAQPSDPEITRHFIQALPEEILTGARPHAQDIEEDPYRTHKDLLDTIWPMYRKIPTRALLVKRGRSDSDSEEEAQALAAPAKKRVNTGQERCYLKKDFDDTPRVPDHVRGNIGYIRGSSDMENRMAFNRRQKVIDEGRCAFGPCRRKRSEHDQGFVKPREWKGPAFPAKALAIPAVMEESGGEEEKEETWEDAAE
jgi:hypothetical protein